MNAVLVWPNVKETKQEIDRSGSSTTFSGESGAVSIHGGGL